ncbi:MAG: hypothetical protein K0R29_2212 [Pseudobdellovibrio sp.]|jgi:hypothetical protein|nr:hypothetical protein [Pseudobdellovibrio sp.]
MKARSFLLFIFVFSFLQTGFAANCVRIMSDGQAELLTDPTQKISVKAEDIYASPAGEPGLSYLSIVTNRQTYRVSNEIAKPIKLKTCFDQPLCMVAKTDAPAERNKPSDGPPWSMKKGDRFNAIASKSLGSGQTAFLIKPVGEFYWVNTKDVSLFINKRCDELSEAEITEVTEQADAVKAAGKYAFGFEVGGAAGYKSGAYDEFITEVPDPSNVGPLSNPIVTEVKKGTGFFVGPSLEINFAESFKLKFGVLYQENTFQWVGKENPTIAPNSLDSLPDTGGTLKNQSVVFTASPSYEFGGNRHRFGTGLTLRSHYYISKPNTITYRVGTVFKANEVTVEAGPKGFETFGSLHLYYQWYPGEKSPFAIRTTVESDGAAAILGLSFFY